MLTAGKVCIRKRFDFSVSESRRPGTVDGCLYCVASLLDVPVEPTRRTITHKTILNSEIKLYIPLSGGGMRK